MNYVQIMNSLRLPNEKFMQVAKKIKQLIRDNNMYLKSNEVKLFLMCKRQ